MSTNLLESLDRGLALPEVNQFTQLEKEGAVLFNLFQDLGIWRKMAEINRLEPAVRCADLASRAAIGLNNLACQADIEPLVSPKVAFLVGSLFKAGQAIDDEVVNRYGLRELDPHTLRLYKYPSYAPERSIDTSHNLRLALLLHQFGHPWFAQQILHGPHLSFFAQAELPNILAALANANLALDNEGVWHSYLHPGVNLFAVQPYSVRTDELDAVSAKDWIDRSHIVAINTTLQHVLRMQAGISFSDEEFELTEDELRQRWVVVQEIFNKFGFPFPEDATVQEKHLGILKQWMEKYKIEERIKKKQAESPYLLNDHCMMVGEMLRHVGSQINKLAQRFTEKSVFLEEYLYCVGMCHDALKAFNKEELAWLLNLKKYEAELLNAYPPEVVAIGGVRLSANDDTQLYAWLRAFEERSEFKEKDNIPSLAHDLLIGPEHLRSAISALLSYADLTVIPVKEDSREVRKTYNPDITERFLRVVYERTSDPHAAVIGYAKLMTVVASLSWYLNIPLPKKGSTQIREDTLEVMKPQTTTRDTARRNLFNISKALDLFGISLPLGLRQIEDTQLYTSGV